MAAPPEQAHRSGPHQPLLALIQQRQHGPEELRQPLLGDLHSHTLHGASYSDADPYVLSTSLDTAHASTAQVVVAYRQLLGVEHRFRVLKDFLALRPVFHWSEQRVRGHIGICVTAAVIEALITTQLAAHDVRDPDLADQHLSARRGLDTLQRVRRITLDAGDTTIDVVTRRNALQAQCLTALGVDTRTWIHPHLP